MVSYKEDNALHGTGHSHVRSRSQTALWRAFAVTLLFMVVETIGGWLSGSLALLADAGHMLTDSSSLALALLAGWFAARQANHRQSYGWHRMEILAAFLNGVALMVIAVMICSHAIQRFTNPREINGPLMLVVGLAGFFANLLSGVILYRASHDSLNVRGAFLHVVADMLGSAGVLVAAVLIIWKGWILADPIIGIIISMLVLFSAWNLLREAMLILLESTPPHLRSEQILADIHSISGVQSAHDLHVWTVTSGYVVLTVHVVAESGVDTDELLGRVSDLIKERWDITHVTIQVEKTEREACCKYH